jgi:hypothetical protein
LDILPAGLEILLFPKMILVASFINDHSEQIVHRRTLPDQLSSPLSGQQKTYPYSCPSQLAHNPYKLCQTPLDSGFYR